MIRVPFALLIVFLTGTSASADSMSGHVSYGVPDGASVGVSFCIGRDGYFFENKWGSDGAVLQLSAGTGGGRFSLGKGGVTFATLGYAVKGTALWTWGHPLMGPKDAVYVGPEVQVSILGRVSVGLLKSVAGPPDTPPVLVTATIGVGF